MKIVRLDDAEKYQNSDSCTVYEYELNDPDINCATGTIEGRYPDKGYCVNEECKELIYVLEGFGTLNKEGEKINFKAGDVILINKGEPYYWEASCKIIMPCTPAWYPAQHRIVED